MPIQTRESGQNSATRRQRHRWLIIMLLLAVILAGVTGGYALYRFKFTSNAARRETIYENIFINGVDFGGLTRAEAAQKLSAHFQPALDKKTIHCEGGGESVTLRYQEFDARYDFTALAEQAWQYGRTGSVSERYRAITGLSHTARAFNAPPDYYFDTSRVESRTEKLAEKLYQPPVNAYIQKEGTRFLVKPGVNGRALVQTATAEQIRNLLAAQSEERVVLTFQPVAPTYTEVAFKVDMVWIGQFSTEFLEKPNDPRSTNIRVAAGRINNRTIYPGEVFSASAALETNRPEHGYARATVIVDGRPADDYGGGVCQVVTTLYNAVLFAELPVVERFNHSLRVSYVDYGFDATVAGDYFDLKFKNDTPHPLLLVCEIIGGTLTVGLYGWEAHPPERTLVFESELVETIAPPPEQVLTDPGLPAGQTVVMTEAQAGYRYALYKTIYQNGQIVKREQVNQSTYKPVQGVVAVGG